MISTFRTFALIGAAAALLAACDRPQSVSAPAEKSPDASASASVTLPPSAAPGAPGQIPAQGNPETMQAAGVTGLDTPGSPMPAPAAATPQAQPASAAVCPPPVVVQPVCPEPAAKPRPVVRAKAKAKPRARKVVRKAVVRRPPPPPKVVRQVVHQEARIAEGYQARQRSVSAYDYSYEESSRETVRRSAQVGYGYISPPVASCCCCGPAHRPAGVVYGPPPPPPYGGGYGPPPPPYHPPPRPGRDYESSYSRGYVGYGGAYY